MLKIRKSSAQFLFQIHTILKLCMHNVLKCLPRQKQQNFGLPNLRGVSFHNGGTVTCWCHVLISARIVQQVKDQLRRIPGGLVELVTSDQPQWSDGSHEQQQWAKVTFSHLNAGKMNSSRNSWQQAGPLSFSKTSALKCLHWGIIVSPEQQVSFISTFHSMSVTLRKGEKGDGGDRLFYMQRHRDTKVVFTQKKIDTAIREIEVI